MAGKEDPVLLLYKELTGADLRKFLAESADATTGGGARDLRLPHGKFRDVMSRLLPNVVEKARPKGEVAQVRQGPVTYQIAGQQRQGNIEYWPPTKARPREGRIARVNHSEALGGKLPETDRGRIFLVMVKWRSGMVTIGYTYEDTLTGQRSGPQWAPEIRSAILGCMTSATTTGKSVQGYVDFDNDVAYCHAD